MTLSNLLTYTQKSSSAMPLVREQKQDSLSYEITVAEIMSHSQVSQLLQALQDSHPSLGLAVLRPDGKMLAHTPGMLWKHSEFLTHLLAAQLKQGMHADREEPILAVHGTRCHLIIVNEQWLCTLLIQGGEKYGQDSIDSGITSCFRAFVEQAWDKYNVENEAITCCRELTLLYQVGETIATTIDIHFISQTVLKECLRVIQAQTGLMVLFSPSAPEGWKVKGSLGQEKELKALQTFVNHRIDFFFDQMEPEIITEFPPLKDTVLTEWPFGALLWIPLRTPSQDLGGILLARLDQEASFVASEQKLLTALAWQTALAIEVAQYQEGLEYEVARRTEELHEYTLQLEREIEERKQAEKLIYQYQQQLEHLANTDALTGLYNRRYLFLEGERELQKSQRYQNPWSVLLLDLDHFKSINDTYGHPVGDQVLSTVAQFCQSQIRSSDTIGRYGGEEFLLILPETSSANAQKLAERLQQGLSTLTIPTEKGELSLTCSIGIAQHHSDSETFDQLLERADQALYRAKHNGRNCVEVSPLASE